MGGGGGVAGERQTDRQTEKEYVCDYLSSAVVKVGMVRSPWLQAFPTEPVVALTPHAEREKMV